MFDMTKLSVRFHDGKHSGSVIVVHTGSLDIVNQLADQATKMGLRFEGVEYKVADRYISRETSIGTSVQLYLKRVYDV